jgi:hypothetical protein
MPVLPAFACTAKSSLQALTETMRRPEEAHMAISTAADVIAGELLPRRSQLLGKVVTDTKSARCFPPAGSATAVLQRSLSTVAVSPRRARFGEVTAAAHMALGGSGLPRMIIRVYARLAARCTRTNVSARRGLRGPR